MGQVHLAPALSRWITEQLARGCAPADMIRALVSVGHDEGSVQHALAGIVNTTAPGPGPTSTHLRVPEPLLAPLSEGDHSLQICGQPIDVALSLTQPRLILFEHVLTPQECAALIMESKPKLERSRTIDRSNGGTEFNAARTSEGTYFHHDESRLLMRINERLAALLRWPAENAEPLQILRYGVGAEYQPHYDYFDEQDAGTTRLVAQGGQRVATLIIYLNHPEGGGATVFPEVGLEVAPVMGNAVFFSYDQPHPTTRTLHGGAAVTQGEKWIATRWVRESPYR